MADQFAVKHMNGEQLPFKVALYYLETDCPGLRHGVEQRAMVSKVEIVERMASLPQQVAALEAALAAVKDPSAIAIFSATLPNCSGAKRR